MGSEQVISTKSYTGAGVLLSWNGMSAVGFSVRWRCMSAVGGWRCMSAVGFECHYLNYHSGCCSQ